MKTNQNSSIIFIMLAVAQMVICNYFRISPYLYVTILPAMILCLPVKINTVTGMLIAFATGIAVDALAEGIIGLNTLSLVPVAFIRFPLLGTVFGYETIEKEKPFNSRPSGFWRTMLAITVAYGLFLALYIMADSAGVRPLWFNALRFAVSLVADSLLALLVVHIFNPNDR